jgi:hypothetical protein
MAEPTERDLKVKAKANALGDALDADVFIYNFEISPPWDTFVATMVSDRKRRPNLVFFLTTEGGNADSAFRLMRFFQARYSRIFMAVNGWCKSAGTLMCIGAHELWIGDTGELGPLDVQIVKADEMDEQKSGLVAEAAFEKLQHEAYKFFMSFVKDIGASEYRVTLRTASDIATKMTVGVMERIFDKLDPVTIGEDYRSNRLAQAYAERLNLHSRSLKQSRNFDALENLLSGYPSHGFVIDRKEADQLFKIVKPFPPEAVSLAEELGMDVIWPRSSRGDQRRLMEFLNDETAAAQPEKVPDVEAAATATKRGPVRTGNGARHVPRNPSKGSGPKPTAAE